MSPFIGKGEMRQKVNFAKCEVPNCFLDIEFKLTESEGGQGDDSGDEDQKEPSQTFHQTNHS